MSVLSFKSHCGETDVGRLFNKKIMQWVPNFAFMIGLSSNFPDKSAYRLIVSLLSNFRALLPQAKLVSAVSLLR